VTLAALLASALYWFVQNLFGVILIGSNPIVMFVQQHPITAITLAISLLTLNAAALNLNRLAGTLREPIPVVPPISPETEPPDGRLGKEEQKLQERAAHIQEVRQWLQKDPDLRQPLLRALFRPIGFIQVGAVVFALLSISVNVVALLAVFGVIVSIHL
jgi:hypothetical protein